jgi:hypothetical protein
MMKIFYRSLTALLLTVFIFSACNETKKKEDTEPPPAPGVETTNPYENSKISVQVFRVDSVELNGTKGWGYNILIDEKMYIHQPNIPAVMGNNGFPTEEKARKAGEFVANKIKNNIIPPAVTAEELDSLQVIN